ncbi:hypothetical protein D3C85_1707770 [compost metagenome]
MAGRELEFSFAGCVNGCLRVAPLFGGEYIDNQTVIAQVQAVVYEFLDGVLDLGNIGSRRYLNGNTSVVVSQINTREVCLFGI